MAVLDLKGVTLEITFPFERSDAVIYRFKIPWGNVDIVNPHVLFSNRGQREAQ